jgi:hypothetical protein
MGMGWDSDMNFDDWYVAQDLFPSQLEAARAAWQAASAVKESLTPEPLISETAIKETGSNLEQDHCEDKLEMVQPAAPAADPVAYVLFSDNGRNIRLWSRFSDEVHKVADKEGRKVVPLYAQKAPALRELSFLELSDLWDETGENYQAFARAVIAEARKS